MPLATGQVVNGRYRIVRLLGQGGMGAVYQAWDQNLDRPCALKENLETSEVLSRQFEREARLLANLNHPNLPRVTDHFHIPNQGQYLVMDFIEGEDLDQRLQRTGSPLVETDALDWIAQVSDALSYLHHHDPPIIHRDIKPANIRITPAGRAVLVDFGIAKMFNPNSRTTQGARAVTPGFSPPEQYGAGATDERSDVYALGATLYALLTGRTPADSVDLMTGTAAPLRPVNSMNPAVSPQVSAAIVQAMQAGRTQRFASVEDFKLALRAATAPLPGPPGPAADRLVGRPVGGTQVISPSPEYRSGDGSGVGGGYASPPDAGMYPAPGAAGAPRVISAPRSKPRPRANGWLLLVAPVGGLALIGLVAIMALLNLIGRSNSPTPAAVSETPPTRPAMGGLPTSPPGSPTAAQPTPTLPVPATLPPTEVPPTPQIPAGAVPVHFFDARLAFVSDHEDASSDQVYVINIIGGDYWYKPDNTSFYQVTGNEVRAIPGPYGAVQSIPSGDAHNIAWWPEWCSHDSQLLFEVQDTSDPNFQAIYSVAYDPANPGAPQAIEWGDFRMLGVPRCSHQGQTVLVSALSRQPSTTWELYHFNLDQPTQGQRVYDGFPFAGNADWSGDDAWVVFMRRPVGGKVFSLVRLLASNPADFQNFELWPGVTEAKYPAISSATGEIAFACSDAATWNLCLVDQTGQNLRTLLKGVVGFGTAVRPKPKPTVPAVTPRWSADGQWIAYSSNADGDWDIYLYNPTLGLSINLTQWLGGNQFEPAWSKQ